MGRTKSIYNKISSDYIVGLTGGEGCFYVQLTKSKAYKAGYLVQLHFHIKLQERDVKILKEIQNTLKCGNVYFQKEQRKNHTQCYRYTVSSKQDILNILIPFFKENSLKTVSKQNNFKLFCQIANLVKKEMHLTEKGIEKIKSLKSKMNLKTNIELA
jgi:hypothetical protein